MNDESKTDSPSLLELRESFHKYQEEQLFTHAYFEAGALSDDEPRFVEEISMDHRHVFDIASLTKALSTAPLMYRHLSKRGFTLRSKIKDAFKKHLDGLPQWLREVSVGQLLCHQSGLPAWRNFWTLCEEEAESTSNQEYFERTLSRLHESSLVKGEVYSDLGYIVAGYLLEQETGHNLADLFTDMKDDLDINEFEIGYLQNLPTNTQSIPTGYCQSRKKMIENEIHDENAAFAPALCGHTGLFSSGHDLGVFLRKFYTSYFGKRFLSLSFNFEERNWNQSTIGLRKADDPQSQGFSVRPSLGHYGFTGTCFWIDPIAETYYLLLTNRTYFHRIDKRISDLRRLTSRVARELTS